MKEELKKHTLSLGAKLVGVASKDRLVGPVCSDPTYLMPEAKTAVVFGINYDKDIIRDYLAKKNFSSRDAMSWHEGEVYHRLWDIGNQLVQYLTEKGYHAVNCWPNQDWRELKTRKPGEKYNPVAMTPEFSHRYAAVAAGLGRFGWSSNVIAPEYGSRVLFSSILTNAVMEADPLMERNPCDTCKLCAQACQAGFIQRGKETQTVTLGGVQHEHGKMAQSGRCLVVCGGFMNALADPSWSIFKPINIDFGFKDDEDNESLGWRIRQAFIGIAKGPESPARHHFVKSQAKVMDRPIHSLDIQDYEVMCGNCQLVCWEKKEERITNLKLLQSSGVVTLDEDGNEVIVRNGRIIDRRSFSS
ncbi:MAG: 4Fe-4S binding protein [Bacillota bacterium]